MKNLSYEAQLVKDSAERLLKFLEIYESGKESEQNGLRPLIRRETRITLRRAFRIWFAARWTNNGNRQRAPPRELPWRWSTLIENTSERRRS